MGPDSNKMLKPGFKSYKYSGLVVYGNNRNRLKWKVKEEKDFLVVNQCADKKNTDVTSEEASWKRKSSNA